MTVTMHRCASARCPGFAFRHTDLSHPSDTCGTRAEQGLEAASANGSSMTTDDKPQLDHEPYFVEVTAPPCGECGHAKGWDVIGPDGDALGTTYHDEADADDMASALNDAFAAGAASSTVERLRARVEELKRERDESREVSGRALDRIVEVHDGYIDMKAERDELRAAYTDCLAERDALQSMATQAGRAHEAERAAHAETLHALDINLVAIENLLACKRGTNGEVEARALLRKHANKARVKLAARNRLRAGEPGAGGEGENE